MLWRGRRQSDNVEDARGQGGGGMPGGFGRNSGPIRIPIGGRAGGGGITGIIILVILFFVLRACGIDPMQILEGGDQSLRPGGGGTVSETSPPASDEMKQFVATVLAVTMFRGSIESACGMASAASGPFYCPGDRKVYLDTDFFDQLANQFGASGDFAEAYVIAHEVGHHVQNLTGILPKFNEMRQQVSEAEANQMSVRVELQADCFAGIWGKFTDQKGILEQGDLEEALNAAQQIGDDTLQKKTQGYVVPESFNHGTSQQRTTWFKRGFDSGKLAACDTFNNPI
jgi:predicted metalloprotease